MDKNNFNSQDLKNFMKILTLSIVTTFLLMTLRIYYIHNNADKIIELIEKENNFIQISSKVDEKKLKEFEKNDPSPFKQIFDAKKSFFTKTNSLGIFIEYNIFNQQCELTSRVLGVWSYLDLLNKNNIPLSINIKTYKIKDDICNRLYGYNKL